ncbi:MAG: SIMPL domain-containing protein [Firmicutes bacterium]|nr:SIMPL domain-containing protein [Bacillota bacterium]
MAHRRKLQVVGAVAALVAAGAVGAWAGPFSPRAVHAAQQAGMGSPPAPSESVDMPNTVTVIGVAQLPVKSAVDDITENYDQITDTSFSAELKDVSDLRAYIDGRLAKLKIPSGNIVWSTPNPMGNSGNMSVAVNVVVPPADQGQVETALSTRMPGYVNQSQDYIESQLTAVNPSVYRSALFARALADAHAQAQLLAADAGEALGPVVAFSTDVNPNNVGQQPLAVGPYATSAPAGGVSNGTWVNGGGFTGEPLVSTEVLVTYRLTS